MARRLSPAARTWFARRMTEIGMFPLGSVLFPHMPLQLRVFEERYLIMMGQILETESPEFGVVLIERGQEVGGGEQRFAVGTVAQVTEISGEEGFVGVVAEGERRIEVLDWLPEEPFPRAVVRELDDLEFDESLRVKRERAETLVRRSLALASEFTDQQWAAGVELSDDDVASCWQLAAITPVGPLDQVAMLRATSMDQLLDLVIEFSTAAAEAFTQPWSDGDELPPIAE